MPSKAKSVLALEYIVTEDRGAALDTTLNIDALLKIDLSQLFIYLVYKYQFMLLRIISIN